MADTRVVVIGVLAILLASVSVGLGAYYYSSNNLSQQNISLTSVVTHLSQQIVSMEANPSTMTKTSTQTNTVVSVTTYSTTNTLFFTTSTTSTLTTTQIQYQTTTTTKSLTSTFTTSVYPIPNAVSVYFNANDGTTYTISINSVVQYSGSVAGGQTLSVPLNNLFSGEQIVVSFTASTSLAHTPICYGYIYDNGSVVANGESAGSSATIQFTV